MIFEYGLARWLVDELESGGMMQGLKEHYPAHWKFIVFMAYCRMGYQSPLKNMSFHLEQSSILDLLEWKDKIYDQKGYNSNMDFQLQSVLLCLYDALTLEPVYYRILAGNIRGVSAMRNTIVISGMEDCVYIADKGFFSRANVTKLERELERMSMQYIIPLRRNNKLIPYEAIKGLIRRYNPSPLLSKA